ncbi:MAG: DUF4271 domain-containing protein [Bacteroidales bacterium]|nr:DUF4271 domain-containing protein [Bacteroidales bacterium]
MDFFTQNQLFVIYVINLSFIAYVRYTNLGFIKKILIAAVNYNTAQQIQKSEINKKSITNIFLSLNFYISAGVFSVYLLSNRNLIPPGINHFIIFTSVFFVIFFIIYLNAGINFLSASVFKLKEIAVDFHRNNKTSYQAMGIILFIINILISFSSISNSAFFTGIIIIIFFYFLRILRYIKINLSKQMNSFYLFLYLCAVEILPILYIFKFLTIYCNSTS